MTRLPHSSYQVGEEDSLHCPMTDFNWKSSQKGTSMQITLGIMADLYERRAIGVQETN